MSKPAPFSEYEAALLLDAYLHVESGKINRKDAIRRCSEDLRRMATSQGIVIDEIYRNIAGITFQMASMESAFRNETVMKPATKMFKHIVEIYRNDRNEYERILKKAKLMAEDKRSNEVEFMEWLSNKVSPAQLSELFLASKEVERQASKAGLIGQSLYENIDVNVFESIRNTIGKNRVFGFLHKQQTGRINSLLNYLIEYASRERVVPAGELDLANDNKKDTTADESIDGGDAITLTKGRTNRGDNGDVSTGHDEAETVDKAYKKLKEAYLIAQNEPQQRHFIREDKEQFFRWLIDEKHLREDESVRVVRTLKQVEDYAKECVDSSCRLLSGSSIEIVKTIEELAQDAEFVKNNYSKNSRPFRALRLFTEYVESDLGQLSLHSNIIIYNRSRKAITHPLSNIKGWVIYKRDADENGDSRPTIFGTENDNTLGTDSYNEANKAIYTDQSGDNVRKELLENSEKDFFDWLNKRESLTDIECKRQVGSVLIAERYALMNDYTNHRLFESDAISAKEIVNGVKEDEYFIKTYNKHLPILKKYLEFLDDILGGEKKAKEEAEEKAKESSKALEKGKSSGKTITPGTKGFANVNSEESYRHWLENNIFNDTRCKKCIEAIHVAERYALLNDYSTNKLFDTDNKSAACLVYELLDNVQFLKTYESYKYSLRMYLRFLEQEKAEDEQKQSSKKQRRDKVTSYQRSSSLEEKQIIDDDIYRHRYPELYSSLSMIAEVYYNPNGVTVSDICRMIGSSDKRTVLELLNNLSWIRKDNSGTRYILLKDPQQLSTTKAATSHGMTSGHIEISNGRQQNQETARKKRSEEEDFEKDKFIKVLMQRYRNGMLFDSIDLDIFRETYNTLFGEELAFDDAALAQRLRMCGVIYKERLFPAEGIIDNDVKEKLFAYIESNFSSGKNVLYYKAIFEDMSDTFANCYALVDEEMLHAYLEYASNPGTYYFSDNYISKDKNASVDPTKEVEEYLLSSGKPLKIEDVCSALSHIPNDRITGIIHSDPNLLRNAKGEYYNIGIFEASEDELQKISAIINDYISEDEYVIWNDVWSAIQDRMPAFIENNPYLSSLGVRNAIARYCSDKFNFGASVISFPGDNYRMWDIYHLYAKHHQMFSADDIYRLSKELDSPIYFDAIAEASVRVSYDKFVSKGLISFDVEATDGAISSFMSKDYIRIREIDSFLSFPNVGYEWNEYLLESYLLSYSKKHKLLNNGLSLNNVAGVIVKREGTIKTFVDACANVIAEGNIELKKDSALTYLVETDMITRRSYKDINEALAKASQIRLSGRR